MKRVSLLVFGLLAGCTAQMVKAVGDGTSPYAPTNERSQGGVIKYLSDGASFIVKRRRESAYKQMYESCDGPYRIVTEGQHVEGSVVTGSATASGSTTASTWGRTTQVDGKGSADAISTSADVHYWYIQYACGAKPDSTATRTPPPIGSDVEAIAISR
jgi:hypothetical protein